MSEAPPPWEVGMMPTLEQITFANQPPARSAEEQAEEDAYVARRTTAIVEEAATNAANAAEHVRSKDIPFPPVRRDDIPTHTPREWADIPPRTPPARGG